MARKWKILSEEEGRKTKNRKRSIIDILLRNRGIKTEKEKAEFLDPSLKNVNTKTVGIHSSEVEKTIDRIKAAIKRKEKIIIYGDYDVDGICGTAILWETLFGIYKNVTPHIPHRVNEGYGLSIKGIDYIIECYGSPGLIITVDNGIVAYDAVDYAKSKGIDVIITDHHVKSGKMPKAFSIVHTTKLCGAGIAYLLSKEMLSVFSSRLSDSGLPVVGSSGLKQTDRKPFNRILKTEDREPITDKHLELAALATVADLVPLSGANRAVVKIGIEVLKKTKRPGLTALFEQAQIKKETIGVYEIGHIIAPRLNAAGRIAHAMDSLRLICTKDPERARKLAEQLGQTNIDRRLLTEDSAAHADLISEQIKDSQKFIFVHDKQYNQGIIGLVASRLVEKHYRPAVVVSEGDKISKGSARSVAGFDIIEYLRMFQHFLIDAGGHPMAAGFTIETRRIEEFKKALIEGSEKLVKDELLERKINIDMELDFSQINTDLYREIQKLSPFGIGNFQPLFVSKEITIESLMPVGRDKKHLKLLLSKDGKRLEAILFGFESYSELNAGDGIDAVYIIEKDDWNGTGKIQLKLRDVAVN